MAKGVQKMNVSIPKCKIHGLSKTKQADGSLRCIACNLKLAEKAKITIAEPTKIEFVELEWAISAEKERWLKEQAQINRNRYRFAKNAASKELTEHFIKKLSDKELFEKYNPNYLPVTLEEEEISKKAHDKKMNKMSDIKKNANNNKRGEEYKRKKYSRNPFGTEIRPVVRASSDCFGPYKSTEAAINQGIRVLLMSSEELKEYRQYRVRAVKSFENGTAIEELNNLPDHDPYKIMIKNIIDDHSVSPKKRYKKKSKE